jgi:hypothetical protein
MMHSVVVTYVVWALAASALPLAALNVFQWKTNGNLREIIRKFKRRLIAERRNHRTTEQKLNRAMTLRRWIFGAPSTIATCAGPRRGKRRKAVSSSSRRS